MEKKRIDVVLVARGLARSREEAKSLIQSGGVYLDGKIITRPGQAVSEDAEPEVRIQRIPYVSRGGLKLEKALKSFRIDLKDRIALDIGASTGGFTDCMLQAGAKKVYAVDVGTGQLSPTLVADPRVVNLEQTNIRALRKDQVPDLVDFFSTDVSFISLTLVLPEAFRLLRNGGEGICLIKPQFEVGKGRVGKKGVVRDPKLHEEVLRTVPQAAALCGFAVIGLDFSPIRGPEGNIEYLMHVRKEGGGAICCRSDIPDLVRRAHRTLRESDDPSKRMASVE